MAEQNVGRRRAGFLCALLVALCSAGCTAGVIDSDWDDDYPFADGGNFGAADASGLVDANGIVTAADSAVAMPRFDAGLDATLPVSGTDAGVARDAAPVLDARPSADTGSAGGGENPEPARLAGITAAHNAVRARVTANPALPPLAWGADIAAVAQAYAEKLAASCSNTLVHSSSQERNGWGENLAMVGGFGGATGSADQAVNLWESEIQCYTYGAFQGGVNATCSSQCSQYGGCGHYTQVVWRKTKRVGCGVADCMQGSTRRSYWVCNYDPPGNYIGQLPY